MSDPLDNLFDETLAQPEPEAPEQVAPEPAPQEPQPSMGVTATTPVATEPQDQRIPITALLDEREKRQQAERRAQEIERRLAEIEAQRQQQPEPDFFDNPQAVLAAERSRYQAMVWNERANMSEMLARSKHGDEIVEKATEAFIAAATQNPALAMEMQRQRDPYSYVVGWHKKNSFMSEIGDDPQAWIEAQVQARLAAMQPQIAQPVQAKPTAPPRSIASQPGAASPKATIPVDPLFD